MVTAHQREVADHPAPGSIRASSVHFRFRFCRDVGQRSRGGDDELGGIEAAERELGGGGRRTVQTAVEASVVAAVVIRDGRVSHERTVPVDRLEKNVSRMTSSPSTRT